MKKYDIDNWYEVRVDGEKVASFAPISREASTKAFEFIDKTRYDLYKDKVLQIVAVYRIGLVRTSEELIHEEHPTVIENEFATGRIEKLRYDL